MTINYDKIEWANNKKALDYIASFFESGDTVLDVGCGTCLIAERLMNKGCDVFCTDLYKSKQCKDKHIDVLIDDITNTKLPYYSFDKIILRMVLHSMTDEQLKKTIDNCRDLLTDGGKIIIIEGIPPDGILYYKFEEIMTLKGWEQVLSPYELYVLLNSFNFENIKTYSYTVPQMSIKKWLKESKPKKAEQIYKLHKTADDVFRAFYNLTEKNNDIFIDVKYCVMVGTK